MFVINYLQTKCQKLNIPHSVPQFCEPKIQARLDWLFIFHMGLMDSLVLGVQDGFPQVWPFGSLCWSSGLQGPTYSLPIGWSQWGGWLTYEACCRDSASQGWAAFWLCCVGQDSLLRFMDRDHGPHHSTQGLPKTSQPWWVTFCSCWKPRLFWFQWWVPEHVPNDYGT